MGTYLNPGSGLYEEMINSEIFIDKTEMIKYINSVVGTKQKYIAVLRPRRFGKSVAADMLTAYYGEGDSRSLFEKCKVSCADNWDVYLNKFDVIRLVMTNFFKTGKSIEAGLEKMQKLVIRDLKKKYSDVDFFDDTDLVQSMEDVYSEKSVKFVIIIDEWDAVFRECKGDTEGQTKYLDFLRDWMKDKTFIALAYMTGILPIKKYGNHSALNMFDEYSMLQPMQLAPYTGFTEEEVMDLCQQYGRNFEKIKEWYDGYIVSGVIPPHSMNNSESDNKGMVRNEMTPPKYSLYSPLSVVNSVRTGIISISLLGINTSPVSESYPR